jgi:lipoprotein-releasing system permease protein
MADVARPFGLFERMLAGRYLRAKREQGGVGLITLISFVGIALAVAVLIIVMSVMNGFRIEFVSRILGVNGHVFVDTRTLTPPQIDVIQAKVRAVPGVVSAAPLIEGQVMALANEVAAGAVVRGMQKSDLEALPLIRDNIVGGDIKTFGQGEFGGEDVIVGWRLADQLGLLPGDSITLIAPTGAETPFGTAPRRKSYRVAALFNVGFSEYDSVFIYMPIQQARLFFGKADGTDRLELRLTDPERSQALTPALREAVGGEAGIIDWRLQNQSMVEALAIERSVMRLILMLLIAIAALNIISGLVMLVKNKGRDIAILRTMGADGSAILRIFIMTGAAIGAAGTLTGLAIGVLFCTFIGPIQDGLQALTGANLFNADVYYLSRIPATIDWTEVAGIVAFSLAASILATLPVEALRYE